MEAVIKEMPKRWLEERRNSEASRWDEMWVGVLHMAPMPNRVHQRFVRDLQELLQRRWGEPTGGQVDQEVNLTPIDGPGWVEDYRIPDLVMTTPDRAHFDKIEYMAGPPLVCIEVQSDRDESYTKLPFYANLGVPEVWIIDRDSKRPEVYVLAGPRYNAVEADSAGWVRSRAVGLAMRHENGKLFVLFDDDASPTAVPK